MCHYFKEIKFGEVIKDFENDLSYIGHYKSSNDRYFKNIPDDLPIDNDLDKNGIIWYRRKYNYCDSYVCPYCDLTPAYYLGVYLEIDKIKFSIKILKTIFIGNLNGIIDIIKKYMKIPKYYYYFTWNEFCGDREIYECEKDFAPIIHYSENLDYMSKFIGLNFNLRYDKLDEKHKKQWCKDIKKTSNYCLEKLKI